MTAARDTRPGWQRRQSWSCRGSAVPGGHRTFAIHSKPAMTAPWRRRAEPIEEEDRLWAALAARVAEQRRDRGLSQRELADLCGTTQSAIARVERGVRPPRRSGRAGPQPPPSAG